MVLIFIIIAVYLLVIIFDLIPKLRAEQYKEFWLSVSFLSVGFFMQNIAIFKLKIDSISVLIANLIRTFIPF